MSIQNDYDRVLDHFTNLSNGVGLLVNLRGRSSFYDQTNKKISISHKLKSPIKLAVLLHEMGHYFQKRNVLSNGENFISKKVSIIDAEIEAWKIGWDLFSSCGIKIDGFEEIYKGESVRSINTYIKMLNNGTIKEQRKLVNFLYYSYSD